MRCLRSLALLLMVVGSINWGLIGFFGYDLVSNLFGGMMTTGARIVFGLVGLAGLYGLCLLCRCCCGSSGCGSKCGCNCKCCSKGDSESCNKDESNCNKSGSSCCNNENCNCKCNCCKNRDRR